MILAVAALVVVAGATSPDKVAQLSEAMATECADGTCGDKVWGSGRGIEDVNGGNVGYYNNGMHAAHARCGGSHYALIVNPPGHRSINQFHIHFVSYAMDPTSSTSSRRGSVAKAVGAAGACLVTARRFLSAVGRMSSRWPWVEAA
eukprot:s799_g6.t1